MESEDVAAQNSLLFLLDRGIKNEKVLQSSIEKKKKKYLKKGGKLSGDQFKKRFRTFTCLLAGLNEFRDFSATTFGFTALRDHLLNEQLRSIRHINDVSIKVPTIPEIPSASTIADQYNAPQQSKKTSRYHPRILEKDAKGEVILPFRTKGGADIMELGSILVDPRYHTKTNVFPVGFHSVKEYASFTYPDKRTRYHNRIIQGKDGPIFQVQTDDNPKEILSHDSASGVWVMVLKRINQLRGHHDKKVSISGPETYGLSDPNFKEVIKSLANIEKLTKFWASRQKEHQALLAKLAQKTQENNL